MGNNNGLEGLLNSATDADLRLAAEAVVDAALTCHLYRHELKFSEETRLKLIDAVLRDPLLTPELFNAASLMPQESVLPSKPL